MDGHQSGVISFRLQHRNRGKSKGIAMETTTVLIKNMVCDRCIKVVREELEKLNVTVLDVQLGKALVLEPPGGLDLSAVERVLQANGFELLVEKKAQLVEKIKTAIIDLIYSDRLESLHLNLSDFLTERIGKDYPYLSTLFSTMGGVTIEKYFILQKIERVKELLIYDELTLSEIAYKLGYSSVQHLSSQFKKVTGMTPTQFKKLRIAERRSLDQVGT
jgi:AraC-like DNA-binding protein